MCAESTTVATTIPLQKFLPRREKTSWSVMVSKRPSSQFTKSTTSSRSSSRQPSAGGWDADDESTMSMDDDHHNTARQLSAAIPYAAGPYCPRRPNLKEILANTAPPPWTLTAFMAYLSANLCLENLEFTMDAGRYKKHYAKMMSKAGEDGKPQTKDGEYVRLLWIRLIDAYIAPNGSREVNLPSDVRDPILTASTTPLPPTPETLDLAVKKTYELMEESVLLPFLNSCAEAQAEEALTSHTSDEHGSTFWGMKKTRDSPPPQSASDAYPQPTGLSRMSTSSMNRSRNSKPTSGASLSTSISNTSDAYTGATMWSGPGMTDDSGSTGSPTNESPMTPPMSPPASDMHSNFYSSSPKHSRDSGMWKKLGRLSGMKVGKKKSSGFDE